MKQAALYEERKVRFLVFCTLVFFGTIFTWFFITQGISFEEYVLGLLTTATLVGGILFGDVAALAMALVLVFAYGSVKVGMAFMAQTKPQVAAAQLFWLIFIPLGALLGGQIYRGLYPLYERLQLYTTEIAELIAYDENTKLETSKRFAFRVNEEISRNRRYGGEFSLLLLEIRFLKEMEDVHGARNRDRVLRMVAELLQTAKREEDFVAQLNTGEFGLLLPSTNTEGARVFRDRLRGKLQHVDLAQEGEDFRRIRLTPVFGIAHYPGDGKEYIPLLGAARKDYEYDMG